MSFTLSYIQSLYRTGGGGGVGNLLKSIKKKLERKSTLPVWKGVHVRLERHW